MAEEPIKPKSKAKQSKYYINNRDFTNEIIRCKHGRLNAETGYQHTAGELSPIAFLSSPGENINSFSA